MSRQIPKKTENWGGPRPNAGRKRGQRPRKWLQIELEENTAKSLFLLTKHRRALLNQPALTEEQVVSWLIEEAWREIEQGYQEAAEMAQEPYIL